MRAGNALSMVKPSRAVMILVIVALMILVMREEIGHDGDEHAEEDLLVAPSVSRHSVANKATSLTGKVVDGSSVDKMIESALAHPRKRKMFDFTNDPVNNDLQVLVNAWTEGSYSPVHFHKDYDEVFVSISGALAFFTFDIIGKEPTCQIISGDKAGTRLVVVPKNGYHAMTAAPKSMGYPGVAVVLESSAHKFKVNKPTKFLSSHYSTENNGQDGTEKDFTELLTYCPSANKSE